ncbi:hypothetical protein B0J12DRAFT_539969, partial [Macrophomina phaseolina]
HVSMPSVYIQVCSQDPLMGDGLVYERVLKGNGIKSRLGVYPGEPHGHQFMFPRLKSAGKINVGAVKGA